MNANIQEDFQVCISVPLIVGGSGSEKTNALLNHEPDIDRIYLYAKDPYEGKYQLLINKRESTCLKYLNDSKAFIKYSNDMDGIYRNIEEYNPNKKMLIVFDISADILTWVYPSKFDARQMAEKIKSSK